MVNSFQTVKPLRYWIQMVLPLVYDDSLSYMELLGKVIDTLNQLVENNNKLPDYIMNLIKEYINSGEIKEVLQEVLANFILNVKFPPAGITPAKGDGSVDDSDSIQGCIDYAATTGGVVYFPYGVYMCKDIELKDNVSLKGFDRYNTRLVGFGGAQTAVIMGNASNLTIADLSISANAGAQANQVDCINLQGSNYLFSNLILLNAYRHLVLNTTTGHVQMDNIITNSAIDCSMDIDGAASVQASQIELGTIANIGTCSITINTSDGVWDIHAQSALEPALILGGTGNDIALSTSSSEPVIPENNQNNVIVQGRNVNWRLTENAKISLNNFIINALTDSFLNLENVDIIYAQANINGNKTLHHTDYYNIRATNYVGEITSYKIEGQTYINSFNTQSHTGSQINVRTSNPISYDEVHPINNIYGYINMLDVNNDPYKLVTLSDENLLKNVFSNVKTTQLFRYLEESTYTSPEIENYSYPQGFCLIDSTYAIQAYIAEGTFGYPLNNNSGKLRKINLSNGSYEDHILPNLGHCQDMTVYNNKLYIAQFSTRVNNGDSPSTLILEIDLTSWAQTKTYNVGFTPGGIIWLDDKKLFALRETGTSTNMQWGFYDTNFNKVGDSIVLTEPISISYNKPNQGGWGRQGSFYFNKQICQSYSFPSVICMYNVDTGEFTGTIPLPYFLNDVYYAGEVEGADCYDGNIYVSWASRLGNNYKTVNRISLTPLYADIVNNWGGVQYEVNISATASLQINPSKNVLNPLGTTSAPFNCLQEAIDACYSPLFHGCNILFDAQTNDYLGSVAIQKLNKAVYISSSNGSTPNIGPFLVDGCESLDIRNCKFTGRISLSKVQTTIENCNFNASGVPIAVQLYRSSFNFHNCTFTNYTEYCFQLITAKLNIRNNSYLANIKIINATQNSFIIDQNKVCSERFILNNSEAQHTLSNLNVGNIVNGSKELNNGSLVGTSIASFYNMIFIKGHTVAPYYFTTTSRITTTASEGSIIYRTFNGTEIGEGILVFSLKENTLTVEHNQLIIGDNIYESPAALPTGHNYLTITDVFGGII